MAGGITVTTQTQSGITGGPPGNNTTETDVSWRDDAGNGWSFGMIPAYGGALIAPWYEITGGVTTITQTSLATSNPDGFIHLLAQTPGGVFTGTEDPTFTLTEMSPTGGGVRRGYDSGTITPSTGPALSYRVRTWIWAGPEALLSHRIDITNPSGTAVSLAASDSLEIAMLGGLNQASQGGSSAWIPGNGVYATIGGTETAWPVSVSGTQDPDYVLCTPTAGSGLKLSAICVRAASRGIAQIAGVSNPQIQYLTNASRLKVKVQVSLSSFPGSTTVTLNYMEVRRRNYAAGEASSFAADFNNPDASSIVSFGTPASPFFSYDEGCYVLAAAGNNLVNLQHTVPGGNITNRWLGTYRITGYTSTVAPIVKLAGTPLAFGNDYISSVDTGSQTAFVRLFKPIVASGATASQLNNGMLSMGAPQGYVQGPAAFARG